MQDAERDLSQSLWQAILPGLSRLESETKSQGESAPLPRTSRRRGARNELGRGCDPHSRVFPFVRRGRTPYFLRGMHDEGAPSERSCSTALAKLHLPRRTERLSSRNAHPRARALWKPLCSDAGAVPWVRIGWAVALPALGGSFLLMRANFREDLMQRWHPAIQKINCAAGAITPDGGDSGPVGRPSSPGRVLPTHGKLFPLQGDDASPSHQQILRHGRRQNIRHRPPGAGRSASGIPVVQELV